MSASSALSSLTPTPSGSIRKDPMRPGFVIQQDHDPYALAAIAAEAGASDVVWTVALELLHGGGVHGPPPTTWDLRDLDVLRDALRLVIHPLREARRHLVAQEFRERTKPSRVSTLRTHRRSIEADVFVRCSAVLSSARFEPSVIEAVVDPVLQVSLLKVRGDLHRYCAEVKPADDSHTDAAKEAYTTATERAAETLEPVDDTRLGIALNYSVFCREVLKTPDRACAVAKAAVDATLTAPTSTSDESSVLLMLRNNLAVWTDPIENPTSEPDSTHVVQEVL
eukprot:PhM_4_TR2426/c5_g1_i1/m.22185/K06630/YWHAE; 14-3-3 protein epsilon